MIIGDDEEEDIWLRGKRKYLRKSSVPDCDLEAIAEQIHGDSLPHYPQPQKPYLHLLLLLSPYSDSNKHRKEKNTHTPL